MVKPDGPPVLRKLRRVDAGRGQRRWDITIPDSIVAISKIREGEQVRLTVSNRGEIRLTPFRPDDWPAPCASEGCIRKAGHDGEHLAYAEVPL